MVRRECIGDTGQSDKRGLADEEDRSGEKCGDLCQAHGERFQSAKSAGVFRTEGQAQGRGRVTRTMALEVRQCTPRANKQPQNPDQGREPF